MTVTQRASIAISGVLVVVAVYTLSHFTIRSGGIDPPKQSVPQFPERHSVRVTKTSDRSDHKNKELNDDFSYVANAAKKALSGDGNAALKISNILQKCLVVKAIYGNATDPQAALSNRWSNSTAPAWVVSREQANLDACAGFLHGDAFSDLPDRPGGYESIKFWADLAYKERNPVALVFHAAATLQKIPINSSDNPIPPESIDSAQADVNEAAMSGDAEALYKIGKLLADGRSGVDTLRASSVMIAACNLGYDCSASNESVFGACVPAGTCTEGDNYLDVIARELGDGRYVQAYAMAQELQVAIEQHTTSSVQKFVLLRVTPTN